MTSLTFLLLAGLTPAAVAEKTDAPPTFNKDVAPMVFSQCAGCHRAGEAAPFPLLSYADVKKRGKLVAAVTQSRQMPPWKADKSDFAFKGERHLSEAQI